MIDSISMFQATSFSYSSLVSTSDTNSLRQGRAEGPPPPPSEGEGFSAEMVQASESGAEEVSSQNRPPPPPPPPSDSGDFSDSATSSETEAVTQLLAMLEDGLDLMSFTEDDMNKPSGSFIDFFI